MRRTQLFWLGLALVLTACACRAETAATQTPATQAPATEIPLIQTAERDELDAMLASGVDAELDEALAALRRRPNVSLDLTEVLVVGDLSTSIHRDVRFNRSAELGTRSMRVVRSNGDVETVAEVHHGEDLYQIAPDANDWIGATLGLPDGALFVTEIGEIFLRVAPNDIAPEVTDVERLDDGGSVFTVRVSPEIIQGVLVKSTLDPPIIDRLAPDTDDRFRDADFLTELGLADAVYEVAANGLVSKITLAFSDDQGVMGTENPVSYSVTAVFGSLSPLVSEPPCLSVDPHEGSRLFSGCAADRFGYDEVFSIE